MEKKEKINVVNKRDRAMKQLAKEFPIICAKDGVVALAGVAYLKGFKEAFDCINSLTK